MKQDKKIVLVTGGTSGIGFGIVKALIESDLYEVISLTRDPESVETAKKQLGKKAASQVTYLLGDISKESDCEQVFKQIKEKYNKLDGLVNCAGIIKLGGIESQTIEQWRNSVDVNLSGIFILSKILLPLIKKGTNPSIVNISSMHSQKAGGSIAYCTCKAGVDMMTKFMAQELAKYKIRVNSVNPGPIKTNIYVASGDYTSEEVDKMFEERNKTVPLGRVGNAYTDIAPMVEFLLSDKSLWTTGACFVVDGGKSL